MKHKGDVTGAAASGGRQRLGIPALLALSVAIGQAGEPWTFEQAIGQARTNHPDARVAAQRVAAARAGLEQANAAFWPRLQVSSSYLRTDHPVSVFGAVLNQREFDFALDVNHPPDADNLNVKGLVTVPLYQGGRNMAGRQAAQAHVRASKEEAEAVRNQLAFETARAFHTVHKTRVFIHAAEAAVRSLETNLTVATRRLEVGALLRAEWLDVEVHLARSREDLVRARHAEALAERALRNLLGLETEDFAVADVVPVVTVPETRDFSGRPELQATRHREQAAEAEVRRAQGEHRPQVQAFASQDYDRGWEFRGSGHSYTAGVTVQWTLWDGRRSRARVHEARANLEMAREEERKLRLAIDLEVEQARLNWREAGERLTVSAKATAQAEESLTLTRARFEQGLALAVQLLDAETALTAARVRRAEAQADQRIALAALRKALGLPQLDSGSTQP